MKLHLSIPKLQRCNRWSLEMDKIFHSTHYNGCNHLSMLRLNLNHIPGIKELSGECADLLSSSNTNTKYHRAASRLAASKWGTSLQSNAISHWLGANLESTMYHILELIDTTPRRSAIHMRLHRYLIRTDKSSQQIQDHSKWILFSWMIKNQQTSQTGWIISKKAALDLWQNIRNC